MAQQFEWNETQAAEAADQGSTFDVLGIVWRRKWVGLCVILLCLGLGYLYCQQATPIYRSEAMLLLIKKEAKVNSENPRAEASPYGGFEDAISTQMLTVCSPKVVRPAVTQFHLANLPAFQTDDVEPGSNVDAAVADAIIGQLKAIRTGDRARPDPNVMKLTFDSTSPEDCQTVLDAVITSYDKFLQSSYKDFSADMREYIKLASVDLEKERAKTQQKYTEYKLKSTLVVPPGRDHERMTLNELNMGAIAQELIKIKNEQSQTKALADGIEAALKKGVDKEALRLLVRNIQLDQRFAARERYFDALLKEMLDALEIKVAYGPQHPKSLAEESKLAYLREQLGSSGDLRDSEGFLRTYLENLHQEFQIAGGKIKELDSNLQREADAAKRTTADQLEEQNLRDKIKRTNDMFEAVVKRLAEMDIVKDFGGITLTRLSEPGLGTLVRPKVPLVLIVAGVFGFCAGVGLCYVVELADRSFRSPDDVRRQLGVPLVGHIPVIPAHRGRRGKKKSEAPESPLHPIICTYHQPRSRQAEAYRAVRTSLYFGTQEESHKVIQITSPNPGDGKTTLAANLAVSIADSGKRVLLVDADFRRPRIHKYLGLENSIGVSTVVSGESEVLDAIVPTAVENLSAMPCGPKPQNPADLLTSPRFKEMIDLVRDKYDFVIVDTPPLLAVTDPSVVAPRVDGVLMVLRLTKHARDAAMRAGELLNSLGVHTLGIVVNGVGKGSGYGYGNYRYGGYAYGRYRKGYGYAYGHGYGGYGYGGYGNGAGSYYADEKTENGRQVAGGKSRDRSSGGKADAQQ